MAQGSAVARRLYRLPTPLERGMSVRVRARFEGGVLRPLEEVDLREGEEVELIIRRSVTAVYGALLRRRPELSREEVEAVIGEIEDEGVP